MAAPRTWTASRCRSASMRPSANAPEKLSGASLVVAASAHDMFLVLCSLWAVRRLGLSSYALLGGGQPESAAEPRRIRRLEGPGSVPAELNRNSLVGETAR